MLFSATSPSRNNLNRIQFEAFNSVQEGKFYLSPNPGAGVGVIIREIGNMVDEPLTVNIGAPGTLVRD